MSTSENVSRLKESFSAGEVKWRIGRKYDADRKRLLFLYVDARNCQDRLDEVLGAGCWSSELQIAAMPNGAVAVCTLTALLEEAVVKRTDCCEIADAADTKGAASTAFKRACAALGVGRYLYNVGDIRVRPDGGYFRGRLLLPDHWLPQAEHSGRTELEIVCDAPAQSADAPPVTTPREDTMPDDVRAAMKYVVTTGNYAGKTIGEVAKISVKSHGRLYCNGTEEEKKMSTIARNCLTGLRRSKSNASASPAEPRVLSSAVAKNDEIEDVDIPF